MGKLAVHTYVDVLVLWTFQAVRCALTGDVGLVWKIINVVVISVVVLWLCSHTGGSFMKLLSFSSTTPSMWLRSGQIMTHSGTVSRLVSASVTLTLSLFTSFLFQLLPRTDFKTHYYYSRRPFVTVSFDSLTHDKFIRGFLTATESCGIAGFAAILVACISWMTVSGTNIPLRWFWSTRHW